MEMRGHRTRVENERTRIIKSWDAMGPATQESHSVITSSHLGDDAKDEDGTVNAVEI